MNRSEKAKAHRRTHPGMIKQIYDNQCINSRRRGDILPNYTRVELTAWIYAQPQFNQLFDDWRASGFISNTRPSCDRLDDYKPYTLDNLQLITWQENHHKSCNDRIHGINNKQNYAVTQLDLKGNVLATFHSIEHAARKTGSQASHISEVMNGRRATHNECDWVRYMHPSYQQENTNE